MVVVLEVITILPTGSVYTKGEMNGVATGTREEVRKAFLEETSLSGLSVS